MDLDIKICGLSTAPSIDAVISHGASHVGFIFFAKSPRNVTPAQAGELKKSVQGRAKTVSVTVDADDVFLDEIVAALSPESSSFTAKKRQNAFWRSKTVTSVR